MILTISTTHQPATDLGYLLHKNPERLHTFDLSFGKAHIGYPEATPERCTAAIILEVDPVGLVRSGNKFASGLMEQYVNDRPYAACSFLSTTLSKAFGPAMNGRSKDRPELAQTEIPLEIRIPVLPARGGKTFVRELFEPLGYEVSLLPIILDDHFPEWGESFYVDLTLTTTKRLSEVLSHLYVLVPVLDNSKHYYVENAEIDKLLRHGATWLPGHPKKEAITRRYLRYHKHLVNSALERLLEQDETVEPEVVDETPMVEKRTNLHRVRLEAVVAELKASKAKRVVDLGCGEGKLLTLLLKERQFEEIVGMDVSYAVLDRPRRKLERMPPLVAKRANLIHGSLLYRDRRIEGFDAAAVVEVIEHLDAPRLAAFERVLFEFARPESIVVTTPNREYNTVFEMPDGMLRHRDHRFEWTRAEFAEWGNLMASRFGYRVEYKPLGPVDETHGAPSQMAVFTR